MSSFEELASGEVDEEWDAQWEAQWAAYTAGIDTSGRSVGLVGFVELPCGIAEVRGDDIGLLDAFPQASLAGVADTLVDPRFLIDISVVGRYKAGRIDWSITNRRSLETRTGMSDDPIDLVESLLAACADLSESDVYLTITLVDNGDMGVGIVDVAGSVALDQLWDGTNWRMISNQLVVLRSGTRTVTAVNDSGKRTEVGLPRVEITHSTLDAIVLIDPGDVDPVDALGSTVWPRPLLGSAETSGIAGQVLAEAATGALCLPVESATINELASGLDSLSDGAYVPRRRDPWFRSVNHAVAQMSSVLDLSVGSGVVFIGPSLDLVDRAPTTSEDHETLLELLVPSDESDSIAARLALLGYERNDSPTTPKHSSDFESPADRVSSQITLRVSTTVGSGLFAELVDLDDFAAMSVPVRMGSNWVAGLSPEHRFILAALRCVDSKAGSLECGSVLANVPLTTAAARHVVHLAERCGGVSAVHAATRELFDAFPSHQRPVLEELTL